MRWNHWWVTLITIRLWQYSTKTYQRSFWWIHCAHYIPHQWIYKTGPLSRWPKNGRTCTVIQKFWLLILSQRTNTTKFQAIDMSSGTNDTSITINVFDNELMPSKCVKMFGLHIDDNLQISSICSRAANHIHALNRVSKFVNEEVKIKMCNTFVLFMFFVLLYSLAILL